MKDVAERAGVSTATVSYVLNDVGGVTEATRQRVLAAIADLNYQPNYAARSLRSRSRTLGLMLPALDVRLSNPTLAEIIAGLTEAAAAQGYYLLLATANADQSEATLAEQLVRTGRVDGVALFDIQVDDDRASYLHECGVPLVCAGPLPAGSPVSCVAVDAGAGARVAMQYLLGLGHSRIGLIMPPSNLATSDRAGQGYVDALTAAGYAIDPALMVEAGTARDTGITATEELLELPAPPTALLACSDELAFGAMHALRDAGLEVGRDVAVVGFDDVPMAAYVHPPLTAMHAPRHALGVQMAQTLIDAIEGRAAVPTHTLLEMRLMVRKSTAPPAKSGPVVKPAGM